MVNLLKGFLVSLALLLIVSCGPTKFEIAKQQSLVVDLTVQCNEKKIVEACDKLSKEIQKLKDMLE